MLGQVDHDGVQAFLGVPYAAPPVGQDRWREALLPRPHQLRRAQCDICDQVRE